MLVMDQAFAGSPRPSVRLIDDGESTRLFYMSLSVAEQNSSGTKTQVGIESLFIERHYSSFYASDVLGIAGLIGIWTTIAESEDQSRGRTTTKVRSKTQCATV